MTESDIMPNIDNAKAIEAVNHVLDTFAPFNATEKYFMLELLFNKLMEQAKKEHESARKGLHESELYVSNMQKLRNIRNENGA